MRILMLLLAMVSLLGESSWAKRNYTRHRRTHARYRVECSNPVASCVGQTNDLICAACVASGEARGGTDRSQSNAIQSLFARMVHKGYPDTICGVAHQRYQYAGKHGDHGYVCPKQVEIARATFAMNINDMDLSSTNFHARYVHPRWGMRSTKSDDQHLYFADGSRYKPNAMQRIADLKHLFGFDRVQVAYQSQSSATVAR